MLMIFPLVFLFALGAGAYEGLIPVMLSAGYLLLSIATLLSYAKDKAAARAGRRRTSERTLHILALAGGWPGAMLAQQWLRHKTLKRSFRLGFWLTVAINLALCVYFVWYVVLVH